MRRGTKSRPRTGTSGGRLGHVDPDVPAVRLRARALEDVLVIWDGQEVDALRIVRHLLRSASHRYALVDALVRANQVLRGAPFVPQEDPPLDASVGLVDDTLSPAQV